MSSDNHSHVEIQVELAGARISAAADGGSNSTYQELDRLDAEAPAVAHPPDESVAVLRSSHSHN